MLAHATQSTRLFSSLSKVHIGFTEATGLLRCTHRAVYTIDCPWVGPTRGKRFSLKCFMTKQVGQIIRHIGHACHGLCHTGNVHDSCALIGLQKTWKTKCVPYISQDVFSSRWPHPFNIATHARRETTSAPRFWGKVIKP